MAKKRAPGTNGRTFVLRRQAADGTWVPMESAVYQAKIPAKKALKAYRKVHPDDKFIAVKVTEKRVEL